MPQTPTSPADSPSDSSGGGTSEVKPNRNFDVRILEDPSRFKDMPLGGKYEGKYRFLNVQQADDEIEFLTKKVEDMKVDVEEYDSDLEETFKRYEDAKKECKRLCDEIEGLQKDLKVQDNHMEMARNEGTK